MQIDQVTIRDAIIDDVRILTQLVNELGYRTSFSEMESRFKMISVHPDYKTIVAVVNNEVVGMVGLYKGLFYEMNGMYMRILAFVIKQKYRNLGVGKTLMKASEEWAILQGINSVFINCGNRDERLNAQIFYKSMGYTIKSLGFVKYL